MENHLPLLFLFTPDRTAQAVARVGVASIGHQGCIPRERFDGEFADGALDEWLTRQLLDQVSFAPNAATGTEFGEVVGDQP